MHHFIDYYHLSLNFIGRKEFSVKFFHYKDYAKCLIIYTPFLSLKTFEQEKFYANNSYHLMNLIASLSFCKKYKLPTAKFLVKHYALQKHLPTIMLYHNDKLKLFMQEVYPEYNYDKYHNCIVREVDNHIHNMPPNL